MKTILMLQSPVVPEDIREVERLNKENQLIISPYDRNNFQPYEVGSYLFQSRVYKEKIFAIFDSNITVELADIANNLKCSSLANKNALILLAFLHMAEVDLEPGISLAEYSTTFKNPNSIKRLHDLRKLDNLPPRYLVDISLGRIKKINLGKTLYKKNPLEFKAYKDPEDVKHWQMYYIFAMKFFLLANSEKSKKDKIASFIHWMWSDFLFSAVAVTFACVFFSDRFGKMLKGLYSSNKKRAINGIRNASWDMTIVSYWSTKVVTREANEPHYIFCSADLALQEVAKLLLDQTGLISKEKRFTQLLGSFLNKKEIAEILSLHDKYEATIDDPSRRLNSELNSYEYFQKCIRSLELQVSKIIEKRAQQSHTFRRRMSSLTLKR